MTTKPDLREYPAEIYWLDEDECFFAFLPDFGHSACSATGNTEHEALNNLRGVQLEIMLYYLKTGREFPPSSYYDCSSGRRQREPRSREEWERYLRTWVT